MQESPLSPIDREKGVCVISGVGPVTGAAIARRFHAGGYRLALLARSAERLAAIEAELPGARAFICDVADPEQVAQVFDAIRREIGPPTSLVHNAVAGTFGPFMELDPADLNRNFQVNAMGLFHLARAAAPHMLTVGRGHILVTGNTASLRGRAGFAGLAPTKAAQRILAEAIARELGPKGVHVAYLVIDGAIDGAWARGLFPDKPDGFFIQPSAIAEELWHLAHQDSSAWSFLAEIRPFAEAW